MRSPEQDLALLESAALQTESLEQIAEKIFDDSYDAAERNGCVATVTTTPEFQSWMAARAETDAAWGRWAEFMHKIDGIGDA
ncbi:MAG TPA: hypothetical protein VL593_17025 [Ramlibacter sp.]|jgi:hypothetical protein|nr:hypothetical protein [Ramlibacter sp.]